MFEMCDKLTGLMQEDMKPALGVTEPGAIALAVSTALRYVPGAIKTVQVRLNSGMLKNALTCGVPNCNHFGVLYAAALGAVGADPEKGLECLDQVTEADNQKAEELIGQGKVKVSLTEISSRIFIEAKLATEGGSAKVVIRDSHTNIVYIEANQQVILSEEGQDEAEAQLNKGEQDEAEIHRYSFKELWEYVKSVPLKELEFLRSAHEMNYALCEEGLRNPRTSFSRFLLKQNGGVVFSEDERQTARLLCGAAIEARVLGLPFPAMSITGSGAHGILATLPLYAVYHVKGYTEEQLLRATALSDLVCMYIKEYSGKLSAFCGCAIAAGCGAACGLTFMAGGGPQEAERAVRNIASSITGMICDGGNQGCVMKGITAVNGAFEAAELAMAGIAVDSIHGINGRTPEETMKNMGYIASPGMVQTEKAILEIMQEKV